MLTADLIADDELLAEAVDTFIRRNRVARERAHHIADHQEVLRQSVDSETWKLVLQLDEMIVERWSDLVVEIAKWAFNEGVRSGVQQRGTT